jgi:hypothetical protein
MSAVSFGLLVTNARFFLGLPLQSRSILKSVYPEGDTSLKISPLEEISLPKLNCFARNFSIDRLDIVRPNDFGSIR